MWLTVMAIASVVQVLCLIAAMVYAARLSRRLSDTLDAVEQRSQPLITRASACVDDVHRLVTRLEHTEALARSAIERATATADRVTTFVGRAKDVARWRAWPVIGLVRGASAALSTFAGPRRSRPRRDRQDDLAEARFGYEGGGNARDLR